MKTQARWIIAACLGVMLLAVLGFVFWDQLFGYTTLKGPIGIE
jgi:hypothetical protein